MYWKNDLFPLNNLCAVWLEMGELPSVKMLYMIKSIDIKSSVITSFKCIWV